MFRFSAVMATVSLWGCGDTLLGPSSIESRIGSAPLSAGSEWEVRWVRQSGLVVDCTRVDAGVQSEQIAVAGSVVLPLPTMPEPPVWVEMGTYRYALALPVLVAAGTPSPPVGNGLDGLDHDDGIWGTSAPLAWLQVEGDLDAARELLTGTAAMAPSASWVEVRTEAMDADGDFRSALDPVSDARLEGEIVATGLFWTEDDAYFLWAGADVGGIVTACEGP